MLSNGLIGHGQALDYLFRQERQGGLRHSYLLLGPPQIGKRTLALTFAMALLCEAASDRDDAGARPCGACHTCLRISHGAHPDVLVIEPAGPTFTIEQIRDLEAELPLTPKEARYKVRILADFDLATREAQNALLKTLEEPPGHALLFLTASDSESLVPTILSRCQTLVLRPVPTAEVYSALLARGVEEQLAAQLAGQCAGRPGWALRAVASPELVQERAQTLAAAASLVGAPRIERLRQAETFGSQERAKVLDTLRLWKLWWHDLLLVSSGAKEGFALSQVERPQPVPDLSASDVGRFLGQMDEIERMVQRNVNTRLAMDVLLLRMPYAIGYTRR